MAHGNNKVLKVYVPKFVAIFVAIFGMLSIPCIWIGGVLVGQFDIFLFDPAAVRGVEPIHILEAYPTTFASIGWVGGAIFAFGLAFAAAYNNGCRYVDVGRHH